MSPTVELTDRQFYEICQNNRDLKFERNANGELIIMAPIGGERGRHEADLIADLNIWNRQTNLGVVLSSSTGFKLPNGADRSPDVAWVQLERWESLTPEQRRKYPPLCPDFVIELRSETDSLSVLQKKMQDYINNGARLGWLIDPRNRRVEIYRPHQAVEILESPTSLSGEDVLPGFMLQLARIFD
ncbi:MAG: Uma2 family endonuclease [Pseudanabaena sp. RU_4_16]|nr:Uma2 family endonuclease [Pseudanabaena sp. RU_4_16]